MNTETMAGGARHHVVAGDRRGALALVGALGVILDALGDARCAVPTSWVPPSGVGMVLQ